MPVAVIVALPLPLALPLEEKDLHALVVRRVEAEIRAERDVLGDDDGLRLRAGVVLTRALLVPEREIFDDAVVQGLVLADALAVCDALVTALRVGVKLD